MPSGKDSETFSKIVRGPGRRWPALTMTVSFWEREHMENRTPRDMCYSMATIETLF